MEPSHPLKALLQVQLATDTTAVLHLPHTIASLTHDCFLPSPHLVKWTTRINSLLHSKEAGARWCGLCLAYKSSFFSKDVMVEFSQSWLAVALAMLSKNEPPPTIKASIRLLRLIFSACIDIQEFQRQVATPNIPKFTSVLVSMVDEHGDEELKVLILTTLTTLISLYPALNRASHVVLSALSLRFLNGSAPSTTSAPLLEAASGLYAVLHFTGGKLGAANIWRKSVDETLAFGWNAFFALRTTFPSGGNRAAVPTEEASMAISLNIDRLRCCTVVLCNLLTSTTQRPVQVPLGPLLKFIVSLLSCTKDDKGKEHADPIVQAMEISVVPDIWKFACDILLCLAQCARHHLAPNLTQLVSYLTFHLEQRATSSQCLFLLTTIHELLNHCHVLDSPLVPTRLAKAILPLLSVILITPTGMPTAGDSTTSNRSKKSKKRVRGFEGNEVLKLSRGVLCPRIDDSRLLLAALDVIKLLLRNPNLSPAMQSITSRILLSILLILPQMSPSSLSPDPALHGRLLQLVHEISTELTLGTGVMSRSLGLVAGATVSDGNHKAFYNLELLLHPRVPPLIRSMTHVESLSLLRAEEPQEEANIREELNLQGAPPIPEHPVAENEKILPEVNATISNVPHLNYSLSSISPSAPLEHGVQEKSPIVPPFLPHLDPPHDQVPVSINPPPRPSILPVVVPTEAEEDEEMPTINMDSDSEVD